MFWRLHHPTVKSHACTPPHVSESPLLGQDEHHVLHMLDFFYFEEHLVIVSELLGDNLYEFAKAVKDAGHPKYFTLPRLCKVARQCLEVRSRLTRRLLWHHNTSKESGWGIP